jgi:hypothetical protein
LSLILQHYEVDLSHLPSALRLNGGQ